MKIIRSLTAVTWHKCVAVIGNFDGVHLGHQVLLNEVKQMARSLRTPSMAIVFEPQPLEFFRSATVPARLTNFREKMLLLAAQKIDFVFCVRFCKDFANLSASDFIRKYLFKGLKTSALFVGEDFKFGKNRQGSIETLREYADEFSLLLKEVQMMTSHGVRVSSTQVRHALAVADFAQAKRLLNRTYQVSGKVIHGDARARLLGFATANISLKRLVSPLHGVYVVCVHGLEQTYYGVANIGCRPTVNHRGWLVETHIFNFKRDIYGQSLQIEPLAKLRDEVKFASIDDLALQVKQDIFAAKNYLIENLGIEQ